jgi:hypothetical protein
MMKRGGKTDGFSILPPSDGEGDGDGDNSGPCPLFPLAMLGLSPTLPFSKYTLLNSKQRSTFLTFAVLSATRLGDSVGPAQGQ